MIHDFFYLSNQWSKTNIQSQSDNLLLFNRES